MANTITMEELVAKTTDLPSMPAAAVLVMQETNKSTANAQSVARALSTDQALTARVLRLANSAYYGLARQVNELNEAVVILGMRSVKNLAMVAASYPWMSRPLSGYALEPEAMWKHATGVAVGAQLTARLSRKCSEDAAFTAGLLHNLGKVAVSVWLDGKIAAVRLYAAKNDLSFEEAERAIFGFDHCQVGAFLARQWNLPEEIVAACRYHHNPTILPADAPQAIVDCVHIGDYLTCAMGFGLGGDGLQYRFDDAALARLGLAPDGLDRITDDYVALYESYELLFREVTAA